MPTITRTQIIDRPAAEVFAAAANATVYPAWNPTMKSVRQVTEGPLREGTTFQTVAQGFGAFAMTIREYAAPRRVKLVSTTTMAEMSHLFILTPQGEATEVEHVVTIAPHGIWRIMAPFMAWMLQRNITTATNALKVYVEGQKARPVAPPSR